MPANASAILGLVSFGETSGYDLKRLADRSVHHFSWSPSTSQVYWTSGALDVLRARLGGSEGRR